MSACTALYSTDQANATTTNAVIDPSIAYDGAVGTLILSFNFDDAVTPAVDFITSKLGIKLGDGLGAFGELPMVAVQAPITRELVSTLKTNLQQYGLLSIYQDRPWSTSWTRASPTSRVTRHAPPSRPPARVWAWL
ncbi:hypothetical protein ACFSC4_07385 [Deinococcus malanensis]|uniref:hypothetical protein n=1 Tax=Deinococcus malanensis TaxID=1706855 RepID=UPI00362B13B4